MKQLLAYKSETADHEHEVSLGSRTLKYHKDLQQRKTVIQLNQSLLQLEPPPNCPKKHVGASPTSSEMAETVQWDNQNSIVSYPPLTAMDDFPPGSLVRLVDLNKAG